jgi:hypothetical protein
MDGSLSGVYHYGSSIMPLLSIDLVALCRYNSGSNIPDHPDRRAVLATTIYVLADPRTGDPHYVGQTRQKLYDRLSGHIGAARRHPLWSRAKAAWIRELLSLGLKPLIVASLVVDDDVAVAAETLLIHRLQDAGYPLFNHARPVKAVMPSGVLQALEYEHLLGVVSDGEIARRYNLSNSSVTDARRIRGIAPADHPHLNKHNVSEYEHLLGVLSDSVIAEQFGVSSKAVMKHRHNRGIPAPNNPLEYEAMLGLYSDVAIGEYFVVAREVVKYERKKRGIPPCGAHRRIGESSPYEHLLGQHSDAEIARRFGLPVNTVVSRRRRLGIPKFEGNNGNE